MPVDLSQVEIFRELPPDSVTRLGMLSRARTFSAGSALVREGDPSDCLYVIVRGRVRVEGPRSDPTKAVGSAELGPGQVVGASGLLDGESYPSTVTATEAVEVVELGYIAAALTVLQYPEMVGFLTGLSQQPHPIDRAAE